MPIRINLSHEDRPEAGYSVGAALKAARGWGWVGAVFLEERKERKPGDHKGPPNRTSSSLTPTEVDELFRWEYAGKDVLERVEVN